MSNPRNWATSSNTLVWYRRPRVGWVINAPLEPTPIYDAMLAEGWVR